jgi:signal transduction histidine kinase
VNGPGRCAGEVSASGTVEGGEHFAAYVAHELRAPLATQRALLELVLADRDADVAVWRGVGEEVLGACRRQERLLEACLVLARSEGRLQRWERVDLAVVAVEALRAHAVGGLERVVVLEPAWALGDPVLLERLAANLVSNAVRHNVVGGRVEVETRTVAGAAVLSVANSGRLIAAGELQRLFRPFQRLESGSGCSGGGLGLVIVRAVADAHGAVVSARAARGGGVEIDVVFPALD